MALSELEELEMLELEALEQGWDIPEQATPTNNIITEGQPNTNQNATKESSNNMTSSVISQFPILGMFGLIKSKVAGTEAKEETDKIVNTMFDIGKLTPSSPLVIANEKYNEVMDKTDNPYEATKQAIVSGGIDAALYFSGEKVAQQGLKLLGKMGKTITSWKATGLSEDVIKAVKNKPELSMMPEREWKNIYRRMYKYIDASKKRAGRKLGEIKNYVKEIGHDVTKPKQPLVDDITMALSDIADTAKYEKRVGKLIIEQLENSGKVVGIEDVERILKNIDQSSEFKPIWNKINNYTKELGELSDGERILLEQRKKVKDFMLSIIDDIPEAGKSIRVAKADYRKWLNLKHELRGISPDVMGKKFEGALLRNNEGKLEALSSLLPERLLDEGLANVINNKASAFSAEKIGRAATRRGVVQTLAETGEGVVGVLATGKPSFRPSTIGRTMLGLKDIGRAIGQPSSAYVAKGIRGEMRGSIENKLQKNFSGMGSL